MTHPHPQDPAGDELIEELRVVLDELDPVPPEVLEAARAAIGWRNIDAELAELIHDSWAAESDLAGVRGVAVPRMIAFATLGFGIELEVLDNGDTRELIGQIAPAGPAAIVVHHAGGSRDVRADAYGRFSVEEIPPGPIRIEVRPPDGLPHVTAWLPV